MEAIQNPVGIFLPMDNDTSGTVMLCSTSESDTLTTISIVGIS